MGNDEAVTPSKPDKASSPVQDQPVVHPYPDWAAVQAYYGPGVPIPPPYFNTAVAPGHPPHPYMWDSQMAYPSTTDVPGNVNAEITDGDGSGQSESGENGAEGSSDASDENNDSGGKENRRKRSSDDTPTSGDRKGKANAVHGGETNGNPDSKGVNVSPSAITCKPMGNLPASNQTAGMEFRTSATSQLKAGVQPEPWT